MVDKIISEIWDKIWLPFILLIFFIILFSIIFSIIKFILIIINFLITYYKDIWLVTKYIFITIILPLATIFFIITLFSTINFHFILKKFNSLNPKEKEEYTKKLSDYKTYLLLDYLIEQKDTKLIEFILNNKPKSVIKQNFNKLISFFLKEKDYPNLNYLFQSIDYDPYVLKNNSYKLISFFIKHKDYDMLCHFLGLITKNGLNIPKLFLRYLNRNINIVSLLIL